MRRLVGQSLKAAALRLMLQLEVCRAGIQEGKVEVKGGPASPSWNPRGWMDHVAPMVTELHTHPAQELEKLKDSGRQTSCTPAPNQ